MRPIEVYSTKYDGSLHYRYVMQLVHVEPGLAMTYVGPGVAVESYRGSMTTTRHTLALFWNNRSYNVHVNWDADWRARSHYVNIATPASWDAAQLRFIDLDLDVIWRTDNSIILDDEDEFAHHTNIFAYPPDLVAESWRSRDEVCSLIEQRAFPFDGSLYAWRP